jgi:hypothetical protein
MPSRPCDPAWLDGHRVRLPQVERSSIVGIGHVMIEVEALLARLRDPERARGDRKPGFDHAARP